jgi:hypothetical protein
MHHRARGRPYACPASRGRLADHGGQGRRRRQGAGLEHAVAARCLGSWKRARTAHRAYATRQDARDEGIDAIEMFAKSRRQHASLGDVSPTAYETMVQVAYLTVRFYLTTTVYWCATGRVMTSSVIRQPANNNPYRATMMLMTIWRGTSKSSLDCKPYNRE